MVNAWINAWLVDACVAPGIRNALAALKFLDVPM